VKAGYVGPTAILVATATCTLVYPQSDLIGGSGGGLLADGGSSGGKAGSAGADASGGCGHAAPPNKPQSALPGGDLDLWFAVRELWFSQQDGGAPVGFDIDGKCTCEGEGNGCVAPCWAATGQHCDGPDGRDNAGEQLLSQFGALNPELGEVGWNNGLKNGSWNTLLRIRNYNGEPDDAQVELDWYMCTSYVGKDAGSTPSFDGTDVFRLSTASIDVDAGQDPDHPKFSDPQAYVAGGVLSARFPTAVIQTNAAVQVALSGARITAAVQKDASEWHLSNGNIAGVWQLTDIFAQLGYLTVNNEGLCKEGPASTYHYAKTALCSYADVSHEPGQPAATCDSLSFGIGFEAVRAAPGPIAAPKLPPYQCTPGGANDPATDSCDNLCDGG
jgi:hypothetical protein